MELRAGGSVSGGTAASSAVAPERTAFLVDRFVERARDAAALVERIPRTAEALSKAVAKATGKLGGLILPETEFLAPELLAEIRSWDCVLREPSDQSLAEAACGLTDVFAGVASTGSVCIAMGPPLVAAASLLAPLHIAVVPTERILERPWDLFSSSFSGGEALRRNIVFITGPSATADMGPLVRGVHGPQRLLVLVLE